MGRWVSSVVEGEIQTSKIETEKVLLDGPLPKIQVGELVLKMLVIFAMIFGEFLQFDKFQLGGENYQQQH